MMETMMLLKALTNSCTACTFFPASLVAFQCVIAMVVCQLFSDCSRLFQIVSSVSLQLQIFTSFHNVL